MIVVPARTVLRLRRGDWKYGDRAMVFRVERVREERPYEEHAVWLEGYELTRSGYAAAWWEIIVMESLLRQHLTAVGP